MAKKFWNKNQIRKHQKAADLLIKIKNETFKYIKNNKDVSEYEIQQFIIRQFKANNLKNEIDVPIVGFNENSATPHYYPKQKSKVLKPNALILLDIWARLNEPKAPYADITWMAFKGKKMPAKMEKVFKTILKARNASVSLIKNKLKKGIIPTGKEVDQAAIEKIIKAGFKENIRHRTGHSLGFFSPHGVYKRVNHKNPDPLRLNTGYTIEPGIYFKNKFGIRSEIDFYITKDLQLKISTEVQKKMVLV